MFASAALFSGQPLPFGGLSNEKELALSCPPEFKNGSHWSDYATLSSMKGANAAGWKWKSDDEAVRSNQSACFNGLLGTFDLSHEDKAAVAGWMLSEMLSEVPPI